MALGSWLLAVVGGWRSMRVSHELVSHLQHLILLFVVYQLREGWMHVSRAQLYLMCMRS